MTSRRILAGALCAFAAQSALAQANAPVPIRLEDALRRAESVHPSMQTASAQVNAAEAEVAESRAALWNNPQIASELARRSLPATAGADASAREWMLGLSQTFETGGQPTHRRAAAAAARDSAVVQIEEARRLLRAEATQRYVRLVAAQQRTVLEKEATALAEEAARFAARRVAGGEDSRLDGNLARIEAERARNQSAAAQDALIVARGELGRLLQLPLASLGEAADPLYADPQMPADGGVFDRLLERPDLAAARLRIEAARNRASLERAMRSPDLTLGLAQGREGPSDLRESVTMLTLAVPIPIFRRNQAAIGKAEAEFAQLQAEYSARLEAARIEVSSLLSRRTTLRERVGRLQSEVIPPLEENLRLARRALAAGEVPITQILLISRQTVEARRELLDAQTEARLADAALETASYTGGTPH